MADPVTDPRPEGVPTTNSPDVAVREASPADVGPIAEVFVRCWQMSYTDVIPTAEVARWDLERARTTWEEHVRSTAATVIVSVSLGKVNGVARFLDGCLESLYVDPAAAGQGIGRVLLKEVIERSRRAGVDSVNLWVFKTNTAAQRFYRRHGFEPDGRERTEPGYTVAEVGMTRPAG